MCKYMFVDGREREVEVEVSIFLVLIQGALLVMLKGRKQISFFFHLCSIYLVHFCATSHVCRLHDFSIDGFE